MNTKKDNRLFVCDSKPETKTARQEIRAKMVEDRANALEGMQWFLSDSKEFTNAVCTFIASKEAIEILDTKGLFGLSQYLKTAP